MGKKNLDKELEDYANRLSGELRIEEKTKDDNQLTSEGKKLWTALRLSKQRPRDAWISICSSNCVVILRGLGPVFI